MSASGRSQRRPAFRLLTAGIAVGIALAAGAAARADDPETLRGEAGFLSTENAALAKHEQTALLELYALEARLHRAERKAAALRSRVAALEQQERSARGQLAVARSSEAAAQTQLGERIRALYLEGETDPISIILGAASLDDAIDAIDSLSRLAEEDDRIVAQVKRTRASLRQALRSLTKRERELRALSATAEATRASLARAHDEKAGYLASLARQRRLNENEIQALNGLAAEAEAKADEIQASQAAPPTPGEPEASAAAEPAPSLPESPSDNSSASGRHVAVSMTMYCLRGYTATGIPVGPGVVATDPSVIPLGTRMYIPGYGEGVAADTGGAVIGLTIDAWVPSCARADAWGRRPVTITIYD